MYLASLFANFLLNTFLLNIYVQLFDEVPGLLILVVKSKPKIYIVDAALRNAVLMNEDVLLNADEMGYVVETAVFRQIKTFYSKYQIGYYREKNSEEREIDILVKSHTKNIFVEVKYREKTDIDSKNPIYSLPSINDDIFVITKKEMDYSIPFIL